MSRRLGWLRPLVSYALHIVAEEQAVTFERLQIQLSFRIEKIYNGVIIRFPACCKIHAQSQMQDQVHVADVGPTLGLRPVVFSVIKALSIELKLLTGQEYKNSRPK